MPPPAFKSLVIHDWRQFDRVELEFDDRLTVLTGANASGKSTILGLLARHFAWNRLFIASPLRRKGSSWLWSALGRWGGDGSPQGTWVPVGGLTYGSGVQAPLSVAAGAQSERSQYDVQISNQQHVTGLYLTSHRAVAGNYANVTAIPTAAASSDQLFEQFTTEIRQRWLGAYTQKTPQLVLKESLIAAAVFGETSDSVEGSPEAAEVWHGFQRILGEILPSSLGYKRLRIRVPDVIVETETGDFVLDEASGGLSALIEVAWQIFLRGRKEQTFTVLLDEPENHLHPRLQRGLIPSLLRAFPGVQFIIATHSPFVVTAAPEAAVYALDYNEARRVEARRLDYATKAASADQTLQRVLGVPSTMPIWAEARFREILDEFLTREMSPERVHALRSALEANGLEKRFTEAILATTPPEDGRPA